MAKVMTVVQMQRKGGRNRAARLSAARRKEIAKLGADARWGKKAEKPDGKGQ